MDDLVWFDNGQFSLVVLSHQQMAPMLEGASKVAQSPSFIFPSFLPPNPTQPHWSIASIHIKTTKKRFA